MKVHRARTFVYADQNFLILCANDKALHQQALDFSRASCGRFVLSPWHFYEIGKSSAQQAREIIAVAETLDPLWILERSDLQVAEFREHWCAFYGFPRPVFEPIGSLAHVAEHLVRKPAELLTHLTLSQFVSGMQIWGRGTIGRVLETQQSIALENQASYRDGKFDRKFEENVSLAYSRLMLARMQETGPNVDELDRRLSDLKNDSFTQSLIFYFHQQRQAEKLRARTVESLLTDDHHQGRAKLSARRQIDRQHAVAALSYCDIFVTNDIELTKLCNLVRMRAPFKTAEVRTLAELLRNLLAREAR